MKKLIHVFTLFFIFSTKIFGIGDYKKGDKVFVWAISGLNVRKIASPKSQVYYTLDYGKSVEIIDDNIKKVPFELNTPKKDTVKGNFKLKGHWVKVKLNDLEGYVFDAYLSKMPPFKKNDNNLFEYRNDYLERVFGKPLHKSYEVIEHNFKFQYDDYFYKNGIKHQDIYGDGCFDHSLLIPDISLEEAYLILKIMFYDIDKSEYGGTGEMNLIEASKDGFFFNEVNATQVRGFNIKNGVVDIFSSDCT